jgi:hypothetical protein
MDGAWLARFRWRLRGAWLWPAFVTAVVVDAAIGHALPPTGDSQTLLAGGLAALVLNLIGVVLLSRPLAVLMRRRRRDLPPAIARNYAGTIVVIAVAAGILTAGILHHGSVVANRRALSDAIARAAAWIGDRAPAQFRRNIEFVSTIPIEPGSIYRACVPSDDRKRTYCVIVNTDLPFASSVRFSGYEPNWVFAEGIG